MCLPFDVDRDYELPKTMDFRDLHREIKNADMLDLLRRRRHDSPCLQNCHRARPSHSWREHWNDGLYCRAGGGRAGALRRLPAGDYTIEPRSMIDVTVTGANGQRLLHETALNDAVVTKGAIARVVQVSVYCDNVEATSFSGDGVIISTPTGSTAYSMSAGGPIVEPLAKNLIISPICAHAMLAKTIVVSPERVISIKIGKIGRHNAYLSVDGGRAFRLNTGDVITTKASQKVTKLVRLKQTSFFEILNKNSSTGRGNAMKSKRHEKILELIRDNDIETQEQLLQQLQECGFNTTQATISRDIKQLRIIKELGPGGTYRYSATAKACRARIFLEAQYYFQPVRDQCRLCAEYHRDQNPSGGLQWRHAQRSISWIFRGGRYAGRRRYLYGRSARRCLGGWHLCGNPQSGHHSRNPRISFARGEPGMLSVLHIENIAVIEQAEILFEGGFNVLTGETGAGKSIVIDAISAIWASAPTAT